MNLKFLEAIQRRVFPFSYRNAPFCHFQRSTLPNSGARPILLSITRHALFRLHIGPPFTSDKTSPHCTPHTTPSIRRIHTTISKWQGRTGEWVSIMDHIKSSRNLNTSGNTVRLTDHLNIPLFVPFKTFHFVDSLYVITCTHRIHHLSTSERHRKEPSTVWRALFCRQILKGQQRCLYRSTSNLFSNISILFSHSIYSEGKMIGHINPITAVSASSEP